MRQGSHHVAQKFTRTTFPLRLARETLPPWSWSNVTSGSSGYFDSAEADVFPPVFVSATDLHPAIAVEHAAKIISVNNQNDLRLILSSCYKEKRFRNASLPESQVSRFMKINPPMASNKMPLNTSTM